MAASLPVGGPEHARVRVWRFADCEFDELRHELRVRGAAVELEAKPLELLRQLLLRQGEVVTKEELLQAVWPGLIVVDGSLATAVSKIRRVLGDEDAPVVVTVPRVGYRLGVPVQLAEVAAVPELATVPAGNAELRRSHASGRRRWIVFAALAAVLLIALGLYKRLSSPGSPVSNEARISSLAVLPLANLSGDPSQDYLADGMTEELITELSRIQALKVISRTSVMQYKGVRKPLPAIARELNVDGIIEGAVARSGNRIRVTAQLIDAKKDAHLWAESYDRDSADILNLQREIASQITREIKVTIRPPEAQELAASGRVNPQAHELYLRGRFFWNQRTPDALYKAAEYFREAKEVDPGYAQGYAGLADVYIELVGFGQVEPAEFVPKARAAAQKALQLDDSLAEAHTALAYILAGEWDWLGSQKEFQRALQLNPGYVEALYQYAFITSMWGREDEAIALAQKALELDPFSQIVLYRSGRVQFHARHYDKAAELFRRILAQKADDQLGLYGLGLVYEAQGKFSKAIASFQEPYRQSGFDLASAYAAAGDAVEARRKFAEEMQRLKEGNLYIRPGWVAEFYANLGEKDEAMRWLEEAYRQHDEWLVTIKVWPRFDSLRSDPRFQDLLRRMNFPN
jgi:TolB-like protein/DNA-binding winged helix-turn-helix (wHTH) protein/cytochrome c-type biogenesis protein CcmH/NrfG